MVRVVTPTGVGTGWVYESGWLLTAEHVVQGMSVVDIWFADADGSSESAKGYVRGTDRYRDLAAIEVDIDLASLSVASGVFTRQTAKPVMSLGYSSNPPTGFPNVRVGVVTTAYNIQGGTLSAFETDATFDPGDSGGPVVDLDGRVMGVSQASRVSGRAELLPGAGPAAGVVHLRGHRGVGPAKGWRPTEHLQHVLLVAEGVVGLPHVGRGKK